MNNPYTAITSLISIALLVVLVFWLYRDFCTDRFRQEMFKLRDELFNEAAQGNISFDMASYGMLRNAINGFIRFGHRLNIIQVILLAVVIKNTESRLSLFSERFKASIQNLDEEQQKLFKMYCIRMNFILLEHLALSAPVLIITLFIPIAVANIAKAHIKEIVIRLRAPLDRLDTAALATGEI
jgi:hypothetical protein